MPRPSIKLVELFRKAAGGRTTEKENARLRKEMNAIGLTAHELDLYGVVPADPVIHPGGKAVIKRDGSEDDLERALEQQIADRRARKI